MAADAAHVATDLSVPERTLAWWRTTHDTRGSFYAPLSPFSDRDSLMSPAAGTPEMNATVVSLTAKDGEPGTTIVTLETAAGVEVAYEFGGIIGGYAADGAPAWRYMLRDATGADTIVGPVVDMAQFKARSDAGGGIWNPEWDAPPVVVALDKPAPDPAPKAAEPPAPAVVETVALPRAHHSRLVEFLQHVPSYLKVGYHEVLAEIEKL